MQAIHRADYTLEGTGLQTHTCGAAACIFWTSTAACGYRNASSSACFTSVQRIQKSMSKLHSKFFAQVLTAK